MKIRSKYKGASWTWSMFRGKFDEMKRMKQNLIGVNINIALLLKRNKYFEEQNLTLKLFCDEV